MSTSIYVCKLNSPFLTLELQEKICRIVCEDENPKVITDDSEEKETLQKFLDDNHEKYSVLLVYSYACLGKSEKDILNFLKTAEAKNIQVCNRGGPAERDFPKSAQTFQTSITAFADICENTFWKEISEKAKAKHFDL